MSAEFLNPYFNPNWTPNYNSGYQIKRLPQTVGAVQTQGLSFTQPQSEGGINGAGIMQAGLGALDLGIDVASMDDEAKAIPTNAPEAQYDAFGRPVYNIGEFAGQTSRIQPRGANFGEVASGVGKGAMAGSAFGLPGAIVGGVIGGIGKAIGGGFRKRKMREAKRKANRSIANRQRNYNSEVMGYNMNRAARQTYYDQINNTNRMYNLYRPQ